MSKEALKLALDDLIAEYHMETSSFAKRVDEIFEQVLALDKMADNARELGLDYEPWESSDTAHRPGGMPQDFTKHEVESFDDWSEWVNPDSGQYFMKCCDCGLVHEMQFKVAKYAEGDACEFVEDADLQAVFRARRTTPPAAQPAPVQEPVLQEIEQYRMQMAGISAAALGYWKDNDGINPDYDTLALRDVAKLYAKYDALYTAAQPAPVQPVAYCDIENWLTGKVWADDVFSNIQHSGWSPLYTTPPAQPSVPDALTSADIEEHIEYVAGWNDCRAAMLEMMK
jgi:hypothetical protein